LEVKTMRLYDKTTRCDVRLPNYAIEIIDREARRTEIQRAVFLWHVILQWIEKQKEPATGADIGVTTPGTDGHQTQGADADGS
jgi:hypothetical protein